LIGAADGRAKNIRDDQPQAELRNWPPNMSLKRKILKAKSWHRASQQTKEAAN